MRHNFLQLVFLAFLLVSCQDQKKTEENKVEPVEIEVTKSSRCYSYTNENDTIYLKVTNLEDSLVEGNLTYHLFEKDRNQGDFEGKWTGDSLFADYKFRSEGIVTTREIFFYKTDSGLIEGYGPVKDSLDKMMFLDKHNLKLNKEILLKPVDCF